VRTLPLNTVRGPIRAHVAAHAALLGRDVLEIGSRVHVPEAWWCTNRDLALGDWTGIDMQAGAGVDVVADMHAMPIEWTHRFTGVVCVEVLEHVARPWRALPELHRVMQPGALAVFTTPWCFPLHAYPNDFYRYSPDGLRVLLEDAGFVDINTSTAGAVPFELNDHGEKRPTKLVAFMHTLATARAGGPQ
jgi:SAM-dependent methyltransferase